MYRVFRLPRNRCARLQAGIDALLWRLTGRECGNRLSGGSQSQYGTWIQMVLQQLSRDYRSTPKPLQQQSVGQRPDLQAIGLA